MQKILIITDAWHPQINGVVRTIETTSAILSKNNFEVKIVSPSDFPSFVWPFYKDISIALPLYFRFRKMAKDFRPDYIHISTEGPLGLMCRFFCLVNKMSFTTSYHTRFPEYLKKMHKIPLWLSYLYFKWFHNRSKRTLVPTSSMKQLLESKGFKNIGVWNRGVDLSIFTPYKADLGVKKPVIMYVGRVSVEKNIQDFLDIKVDGTKVIVGDGPLRRKIEKEYPDILFLGFKKGQELAKAYSQADVFVFPSKSDTYGLVLLEALACGVPFAAYPEPGPIDIASEEKEISYKCCFIGENLEDNVKRALDFGTKESALNLAKVFSWENCTNKFIRQLRKTDEI